MRIYRQTLWQPFEISGIGIHSGQMAKVMVSPNTKGTGIIFKTQNNTEIPARYNVIYHTQNSTNIGDGKYTFATIEHLMSALYAFNIHDAIVTCDQTELPIIDGSSIAFVHAIETAGITTTQHRLEILKMTDTITVSDNTGGYISLSPYKNSLYINASIDFAHPCIGIQTYTGHITPDIYKTHIAPARTFGFINQLYQYQKYNLARGASVDTAVVFDDDRPLNDLRFTDEPIRHKVLDILGDISLCGFPIHGKITAHKMGHTLNNQLLKKLFENPHSFTIIKT